MLGNREPGKKEYLKDSTTPHENNPVTSPKTKSSHTK
jgi:hypothetical protein